MLEIKNIATGYGKKQVLYDISMEISKGDVVLITGGNGSGKSTLLKCIYNTLPLWSGEVFFEGERIDRLKPSNLIQKGIVYIPQKDFYFENLTVEENLQISGYNLPKRELKDKMQEIYELTGLIKYRKRKPFNLSGGERKILAFGMGLIHNPKLLLFDEPFAGVDTKNSDTLLKLLNKSIIKSDNGLIVVEHRDELGKLFTKKIIMELGTLKTE